MNSAGLAAKFQFAGKHFAGLARVSKKKLNTDSKLRQENEMLTHKMNIMQSNLLQKLESRTDLQLKRRIAQLEKQTQEIETSSQEEIARWRKLAGTTSFT